jgi:hypothetical protein
MQVYSPLHVHDRKIRESFEISAVRLVQLHDTRGECMTQRQRPSKTITLAPDLMERLETEASLTNRSVSQLMEAHLRDYYLDGSAARLDRLEATLNDFRASVLPVVTKVAKYLQELEGEGSSPTKGDGQPPKIATYEEMYGPIPHTPQPVWTPPMAAPKPRKRWPWSS